MTIQDTIEKADKLYLMGQCDAAVDLLLDAVNQIPESKLAYYRLAELFIDSKQFESALDILNKIPQSEPDLKNMELAGYCFVNLGNFDAAAIYADQILSHTPDSAPALNIKGLTAVKKEDRHTAQILFNRSIAHDSEYGEPYTHLATLKWESLMFEEALDLFEKGFISAPTISHIALAYHTAIVDQKAFARGAGVFQKALALHPHSKRLRYLLIDLYIKLSDYDGAMQEIEAAMALYGIEDGILPAALSIRDQLGPLEIDGGQGDGAAVSLCMIVKNEERQLAVCLGNAKPVVDEMIVVDTGSSDKTKDIARAFGAKVYDFNWAEDFAAARNFSLSKSHGDWVFILDADEVISPLDHDRFRTIVRSAVNGAAAYSIETRNYTFLANMVGWTANNGRYRDEEAGTGWIPSIKVRLFPNSKDVRFVYPVHEVVDPCLKRIGIRIETCGIPIHHYGKLTRENLDNKGEAYFQIGLKKLDEMGDNIVALRELAIQAGNLEKWTEAIRLWQRLLRCKPNFPEAFVNIGTACWQLGKYEDALTWASKAVALQPDLKEAHFNFGITHLCLGDAVKAVAVLEKLLEQHPNYLAARFMLTAAYCCAGNKGAALAGCRHIQQTEIGPVLAVSFYDLAERLAAANAIGYAITLLETAIECQSANEGIRKLLSHCLQKIEESSKVPG